MMLLATPSPLLLSSSSCSITIDSILSKKLVGSWKHIYKNLIKFKMELFQFSVDFGINLVSALFKYAWLRQNSVADRHQCALCSVYFILQSHLFVPVRCRNAKMWTFVWSNCLCVRLPSNHVSYMQFYFVRTPNGFK